MTQVLSDGTNTYLYGNGRIAQASNTTEYFLGDALGSVRQLADATGAVTLTQSYSPYGETISSVGNGTSVYQYTGEIRDANGLTYLRARYYNPGDGRFISRDTWNGDYNRPLSLNRWGYVEGNPVNYTDPTGLKIKKDGVDSGEFLYSCNCGWIDTHHAVPGTTNTILSLLRININPPDGMNQSKRVLRLKIHTPYFKFSFSEYYVVKNDPVNGNKPLALGILMNLEDKREALQGTPGLRQISHSYYSEEDLTSNVIGYHMAINNKASIDDDNATFNWLASICKMPSTRKDAIEWSQKVFKTYGDSVEEWEKWANPRLECSDAIDSFCGDAPREWPSQFSIDSAVQAGMDWSEYDFWKDGFRSQSNEHDDIFYLWP